MADFQVNAVVMCDDIRREVNQKDILIGAYGSSIFILTLPNQFNLAFWIEFTTKRKGQFELFLMIDLPNQLKKIELRISMDLGPGQDSYVVFTPQIPCYVEREGNVRVFAKSKQEAKFELIKSRKIVYTPLSPVQTSMNEASPSSAS